MTIVTGRSLLVVEDEYALAFDLAGWLESKGADVLGPVESVADALALLDEDALPDVAVLDINLGSERVFPVADALQAAGVPFVFLSGYDSRVVPQPYRNVPLCTKPVDNAQLLRALGTVLAA